MNIETAEWVEKSKADAQGRGVLVHHTANGNTSIRLHKSVAQGQVSEVWADGARQAQATFDDLAASLARLRG